MLRVAGNFPSYKKYEATGWRCQACPYMVREDQDHLTQCSGYSDLKINFDNDEEIVKFYSKEMKRREANGGDKPDTQKYSWRRGAAVRAAEMSLKEVSAERPDLSVVL